MGHYALYIPKRSLMFAEASSMPTNSACVIVVCPRYRPFDITIPIAASPNYTQHLHQLLCHRTQPNEPLEFLDQYIWLPRLRTAHMQQRQHQISRCHRCKCERTAASSGPFSQTQRTFCKYLPGHLASSSQLRPPSRSVLYRCLRKSLQGSRGTISPDLQRECNPF